MNHNKHSFINSKVSSKLFVRFRESVRNSVSYHVGKAVSNSVGDRITHVSILRTLHEEKLVGTV